jgi:hypothetical protein
MLGALWGGAGIGVDDPSELVIKGSQGAAGKCRVSVCLPRHANEISALSKDDNRGNANYRCVAGLLEELVKRLDGVVVSR